MRETRIRTPSKTSPSTAIELDGDNDNSDKNDDKKIDECRGTWGNQLEFLLSTLGMAVGLGNIWRFPTRAYNNGGSAFLIPYISCALLFGLPAVYLEFLLGQYHRTTAPVIFRRIAPILQGVGWMAVAVSSCVAIYYVILIGWSTVYMSSIIMGHTTLWNKCDNEWNDAETCFDLGLQYHCANVTGLLYFKGACRNASEMAGLKTMAATEQYFFNYVVRPSTGFLDFNHINIRSFVGVNVCWIIVAIIIWQGVDYMGKASYITVILPYIIIVLLFLRGITLDGASDGLYYYLGNPDWSKVFTPATWGEALKQLCFSLGIGYGGLIGLASYSKPDNNCYRDALIVIMGDTIMSVIGGAAVFSTLGFLAKQKGCEVADVVDSGLSLAFVAFPEALGKMPAPWLWSFLFFIMLFFLGISTEVAYVNVFCSAICDQFVSLRKHKWIVVIGWCTLLYTTGLVMVTDGGFYWFIMFDEYAAGVSSCVAVTMEVGIIGWWYGVRNMREDMVEMLGPARSTFAKVFGVHTPYFGFAWMVVTPVLGMVLIVLASIRSYPHEGKPEVYPIHFDIVGWFICILPMLMVPIFAFCAYREFDRKHLDKRGLWMKQKQLRSYPRIVQTMTKEQLDKQSILPDKEPWDDTDNGIEKSTLISNHSKSL